MRNEIRSSGAYDVTINANGFRPILKRGKPITANVVRREDAQLELGQVSETVTVEAGQVALQTDKADLHTEIGSQEANISAANFMAVTSAQPDQRQVRLGLRLAW